MTDLIGVCRNSVLASLGLFFAPESQSRSALAATGFAELQLEQVTHHDSDGRSGHSTLLARGELAPTWTLTPGVRLESTLVLESLRDPAVNDDHWAGDEGVFVEELKLVVEQGSWQATLGKFNPAFGSAWNDGRGIWSRQFAEGYEITERLGAGLEHTGPDHALGRWSGSISAYVADTTALSDAVITSRPRTDREDGGPANTDSIASGTATLSVERLLGVERLVATIAYRHQGAGDADPTAEDETGVAVTVEHGTLFSPTLGADVLVEYVDIQHFETQDADASWLTTGAVIHLHRRWRLAASHTRRRIGGETDDRLLQLSGGYRFNHGATLEIGWRRSREAGEDADIIGARWQQPFQLGESG